MPSRFPLVDRIIAEDLANQARQNSPTAPSQAPANDASAVDGYSHEELMAELEILAQAQAQAQPQALEPDQAQAQPQAVKPDQDQAQAQAQARARAQINLTRLDRDAGDRIPLFSSSDDDATDEEQENRSNGVNSDAESSSDSSTSVSPSSLHSKKSTIDRKTIVQLMLPEKVGDQTKILLQALATYIEYVEKSPEADFHVDSERRYMRYMLKIVERMRKLAKEQSDAMTLNPQDIRPMRLVVQHICSVKASLKNGSTSDIFDDLQEICFDNGTLPAEQQQHVHDTIHVFVVSKYEATEKYCVRQNDKNENQFVICNRYHFLTALKALPVHLYVSLDAPSNFAAFAAPIAIMCSFTGFKDHLASTKYWMLLLLSYDFSAARLTHIERAFSETNELNRAANHSINFITDGGALIDKLRHQGYAYSEYGAKCFVSYAAWMLSAAKTALTGRSQ